MAVTKEDLSPADKAALDLATDLSSQFRRVLEGLRTFPPGHKTLTGYLHSLHERLTQAVGTRSPDEGYWLGVTPLGLKWGAFDLNPAESLADSFTQPLYLDGVHQLNFNPGLALENLTTFMGIWRATLDNKLGDTHTFCTKFWEADLPSIGVVAVETFSEHGVSDGQTRTELQEVVEGFSNVGLPGVTAPSETSGAASYRGSVSRIARISRDDLDQLRAQGIPEMSQEDLARYDQAERAAVAALSPDELQRLATELAAVTSQQIERATEAMFQSGVRASPEELASLRHAFALVVTAMAKQGMLTRLRDILAHRVAETRKGNTRELAARFQVVSQLMGSLLLPSVLEPLILALDDEAQAPTAVEVLRYLPDHATSTLLSWLSVPRTPKGRRTLAEAIMLLRPTAEELAAFVGWADEGLALELMHISSCLPPKTAWPVRRAAMNHAMVAVRRAAFANITKEMAVGFRHLLVPMLASPDPEIRKALFPTVVATGDKTVAPVLAGILKQGKPPVETEERRRIIQALGQLGGEEACDALRTEYTHQRDVELRILCVGALAHAGDEKARPLLKEAAGKLFGGGELKKVAAAALKRLDQLKAGGKP